MRKEYDFTGGVRAKYYTAYWRLPRTVFQKGELNPSFKASDETIQYIRDTYFPYKFTVPMLREKTGLSESHIRKVIKGIKRPNGEIRHGYYRRLKDPQVRRVFRLAAKGFGYRAIGRKLGLSKKEAVGIIRPILKGKTYKKVVRQ